MRQLAEKQRKAGQRTQADVARWQFFDKEAERMLGEAKAAHASPMMGSGGMMAGMMGGGGDGRNDG